MEQKEIKNGFELVDTEAIKLVTSYDEAIKIPKLKNAITARWRKLGLVEGLPLNSKKEKLVIEGFERMARYLIHEKANEASGIFQTIIFPLTRLIYTGEKLTGKRLHSIIMPEDLYSCLDRMTFETMEDLVKENAPKLIYDHLKPMFRLMEYKHLSKKTLTTISESDMFLNDDEINLLTILFCKNKNKAFDFVAEITCIICSCVVYHFNTIRKQTKQ